MIDNDDALDVPKGDSDDRTDSWEDDEDDDRSPGIGMMKKK